MRLQELCLIPGTVSCNVEAGEAGTTICPAPMTPRRLTSCTAAIGLELKHLDCRAEWTKAFRSAEETISPAITQLIRESEKFVVSVNFVRGMFWFRIKPILPLGIYAAPEYG